MKKRTYAFLICLLSAALVSCQSGQPEDPSGSGQTPTETAGTSAADTADAGPAYDYSYPELTLNGKDITILYMTQPYYFYDSTDFEDFTGETVDDAVYKRNRSLEERFHMNLKFDTQYELSDAASAFSSSILAGDDTYDAAWLLHRHTSSLFAQGYLIDLNTLSDHFTFGEPWWNGDLNDVLQLGASQKRLCAFSDAALATFEGTMITFINEGLCASLDLESPYELVKAGKWTVEAMRSYMKAGVNLNGDADFTYKPGGQSVYGLTSFDQGEIALLMGCGAVLFEQDRNGQISYMPDTAGLITDAQKIIENLSVSGEYLDYNASSDDNFETVFQQNRALLMIGELKAASLLRNMDADFGILPMPKYDEAQKSYRNMLSIGYLVCIPTTCSAPEVSADVLDALTFETYRDVLPLFCNERISQKALRNEVSIEMLSLIQQTRCLDIGYIFGWNTQFYTAFHDAVKKGSVEVASAFEKTVKQTEKQISQTMEAVNENEG